MIEVLFVFYRVRIIRDTNYCPNGHISIFSGLCNQTTAFLLRNDLILELISRNDFKVETSNAKCPLLYREQNLTDVGHLQHNKLFLSERLRSMSTNYELIKIPIYLYIYIQKDNSNLDGMFHCPWNAP